MPCAVLVCRQSSTRPELHFHVSGVNPMECEVVKAHRREWRSGVESAKCGFAWQLLETRHLCVFILSLTRVGL